jgi:hypothetical protein
VGSPRVAAVTNHFSRSDWRTQLCLPDHQYFRNDAIPKADTNNLAVPELYLLIGITISRQGSQGTFQSIHLAQTRGKRQKGMFGNLKVVGKYMRAHRSALSLDTPRRQPLTRGRRKLNERFEPGFRTVRRGTGKAHLGIPLQKGPRRFSMPLPALQSVVAGVCGPRRGTWRPCAAQFLPRLSEILSDSHFITSFSNQPTARTPILILWGNAVRPATDI